MESISFEAIGTRWTIATPKTELSEQVLAKLTARIEAFDAAYSRFRSDSLVSEMARRAGSYVLPADAKPLFDLYYALYTQTDGALTPLIGSALEAAGYDARYSFRTSAMPTTPKWEETFTYAFPNLTLHTPALLDVGAAGKGYLVDLLAELLLAEGIAHFVIDAGGDVRVQGIKESIALEDPLSVTQAIGVATIANASICGSSGNRRAWGEFHHIINPRTQSSPKDVLGVWVVAKSTMLADALATCLYLVPATQLKQYAFEYLILRPDYSIEQSPAFPATLFTSTV